MKVILWILILTSAHAYAQGLVFFANNSPTRVTNGLTSAPVVAGTFFNAALYFLPATGAPDEPPPTTPDFDSGGVILGSPVGFFLPGIFLGGTLTTPTLAGAHAWFQVRCWETAFGATYEQAIASPNPIGGRLALAGTSNILRLVTGDPHLPGAVPTLIDYGLQGFTLSVVPEPSAVVLLGLGVGATVLSILSARRQSCFHWSGRALAGDVEQMSCRGAPAPGAQNGLPRLSTVRNWTAVRPWKRCARLLWSWLGR